MSIYYYLICKTCKVQSKISFTSQAWGWGNAYAGNTFRFLMAHSYCDIGVINEFDTGVYPEDNYESEKYTNKRPKGFLEIDYNCSLEQWNEFENIIKKVKE